ncbi:NAD(P)/FAD-dependent oxidoreductase [Clostridium magnum]|uniref:L-2-hydroxyglutarate oxidase LhgO n=1 Tax=Clostridium magnum DSM 2767 TaxID=1121326 RepID=A0A162QD80_9CLOT|nr:FAD-dependent oxidoreductase [Clostridium magnum]KZL88417.1 L-2-hydroxyglutarate oxidase LhgO [Clostridium magnum DSM 2767]SHJ26453.1 L-2-hydroxyglutarate oxidase LhgO [Clostridium magnum DSM 2767]
MDYDVLILGGGIIGCAVAYELSKYSLNIALIEKDYDIADDVALLNSAIVYDGVECEDTLVAKLELMGNKLIDDVVSKFNVRFKKCNSLIIAEDKKSEEKLINMYDKALNRGIDNIYLLDSKEVYKMEPNLTMSVKKAIYSKNTGIIAPYDLAIAYGEVAFDNGVNFKLEEEVLDIQKVSKGFRVITNKNKFSCNMVLNTTPGENYSIDGSSKVSKNRSYLKHFLLDKSFKGSFKNIVSTISETKETVYSVPTVQENSMISIKTDEDINYHESLRKISNFMGKLSDEEINTFYESPFYNDTLIIDDSLIDTGYIKVTGKHYGQVTMTPAIAKIVCETIINNLNCILKKDFVDKRREFYRFRYLSNKERNDIIKVNKNYGKIVCYCKKVTEGEIIDSIRRPLGARTLEGIKRRTEVTFGSCNGAQCLNKIATILARETNKSMTEIVKDSKNSRLIVGRIKEFDEI